MPKEKNTELFFNFLFFLSTLKSDIVIIIFLTLLQSKKEAKYLKSANIALCCLPEIQKKLSNKYSLHWHSTSFLPSLRKLIWISKYQHSKIHSPLTYDKFKSTDLCVCVILSLYAANTTIVSSYINISEKLRLIQELWVLLYARHSINIIPSRLPVTARMRHQTVHASVLLQNSKSDNPPLQVVYNIIFTVKTI